MKKILAIGLLMLLGSMSQGQDKKKVSVEVFGVEIHKYLKFEDQEIIREYRQGITLRVLMKTESELNVVGIDDEKSKLESVVDDKNTDLSKPPVKSSFFGFKWVDSFNVKCFPDGKRFATYMRFQGVPAPGATSISVKGTLEVQVGSDIKTVEKKELSSKVSKDKVEIGGFKLIVTQRFDKDMSVNIESNSANIKLVEFTDEAGKALKTNSFGAFRGGFGKNITVTQSINVQNVGDKFNVKVSYYDKLSTETLPVDFKVTLGN